MKTFGRALAVHMLNAEPTGGTMHETRFHPHNPPVFRLSRVKWALAISAALWALILLLLWRVT
jgi:hypothetical protein